MCVAAIAVGVLAYSQQLHLCMLPCRPAADPSCAQILQDLGAGVGDTLMCHRLNTHTVNTLIVPVVRQWWLLATWLVAVLARTTA